MVLAVVSVASWGATFTVDATRSKVRLSGTVSGIELREQSDGSLTTTGDGTISVTIGAASVQVTGGLLDTRENGSWSPGPGGLHGTAPADFGGRGDAFLGVIDGALRNIQLSVASPAIPWDGTTFNASPIVFTIPANSSSTLDYNAGIFGTGSRLLAGETTNNISTTATIVTEGEIMTLTLAVDAIFFFSLSSPDDTALGINGTIVATAPAETDPTPVNPIFNGIQVVNGRVRFTVDQPGATRLQSSTDLQTWADQTAEIEDIDADTKQFSVPATGPRLFFRMIQ